MTRISLKIIAKRLHRLRTDGSDGSARELANPRFVECLCFVQAMSQLPGGLEKFCEEFLKDSPGWLRPLPPRNEWDFHWQELRRCEGEYACGGEKGLRAKPKDHEDDGGNSLSVSELAEYLASWCGAVPNGYSWGGVPRAA